MKKFNYIYRGLSFVFVFVFSVVLLFLSTNKTQAALSDLFISEYVEGSSNNKAIELYNGTGETIDLGAEGYNIKMFFNGSSTAGLTINLSGTVADGDVFVLVHSSASTALLAYADQTGGSGWFNGNDAVALYKGATLVDCIGRIGQDPGSAWVGGGLSTMDRTLVRKSTITSGDINPSDAFDPSFEWIGYPIDAFNNLGSHTIASYTVTFDLGDHGSLGSGTLIQTVTYGSGATAPVVVEDVGYNFIGWDVAFDNITGDLTVTAQWEPIIITNLPEIQNLTVGDKLNLAPEPKGGEWTYDPEFLKLNEDGSFTALKAGNTIVEYTYNGVNSRVEIVIKDQVIVAIIESLPKTGGFIPLLTAASLVLGGSMIINKSRKK